MTGDYLYDPSTSPDPDVQDIERRLALLRFDPAAHPLAIERRSHPLRWFVAAAAAFLIAATAAGAYYSWRLDWHRGEAWSMHISGGTRDLSLPVAQQMELREPASLDIARLGEMQLSAGATVKLEETGPRRHRLALERGTASVRLWAPPGRFGVRTPAGEVLDLGCVFDIAVEADGTTRVGVKTGWVQLSNAYGESLVPAGASSSMSTAMRPRVPVYRDAPAGFAAAVRAFEDNPRDRRYVTELRDSLAAARRRDALTLLVLANASPVDVKQALLERAAELVPPPAGVSIAAIVAGNRDQFWQWYAHLDLPPVKSWWRNWRDVLPW
jgi:hypothetical protein